MSKNRVLTPTELELWHRVTADVRPINPIEQNVERQSEQQPKSPKRSTVKIKNGKISATPRPKDRSVKPVIRSKNLALDPTGPVDMDRKNWERLKRGQLGIERKLDLHGQTQSEAHAALNRFLAMASATGLRCVLVVTGKGGAEGKGILRQMVPRWLAEADNRDKILTYCSAQPRHGGNGALYVLLRRSRSGRR